MGDGGDGNGATYLRRRRQGDPGGFAEEDKGNGGFLGTERSRDENCDFFREGTVGQKAEEEAAFQDEEMTKPTSFIDRHKHS
jgi:hypothetical protein